MEKTSSPAVVVDSERVAVVVELEVASFPLAYRLHGAALVPAGDEVGVDGLDEREQAAGGEAVALLEVADGLVDLRVADAGHKAEGREAAAERRLDVVDLDAQRVLHGRRSAVALRSYALEVGDDDAGPAGEDEHHDHEVKWAVRRRLFSLHLCSTSALSVKKI